LGPLSASSKARPNPPEPRTLGSTHAYPCPRKKAVIADQRIRELPDGPPWYETITGSLPACPLGRKTLVGSVSPSCACTCVMLTSISGTSFSEGRISLRSRAALPVPASLAHASVGDEGVDQSATIRLPSSEKSATKPWPSGISTLAPGRSA